MLDLNNTSSIAFAENICHASLSSIPENKLYQKPHTVFAKYDKYQFFRWGLVILAPLIET